MFYNAIHAAFPSLKIIATSTSTGGSPFDILDDHFYQSPQWFESNSHHYDNTPRGSYQIFVGEYASLEGSPTNDMNAALGDASWLLGLERNSDLVTMSSYAPLWVNVNGIQWTPDLIGFNGTTSYGSPSYYAQVMLSQNHGTTVVSDTVSGAGGLQTLVTKTGSTYYLTVINTSVSDNSSTINLGGVTSVSSTATVTSMSAPSSTSTNSLANPTNVVPVTSTFSGLGPSFSYTFPAYSITILQFDATVDTPTVATAANANPSPVTGTTTNLSVLGADSLGEANLTYTWSVVGPGAVSYSANGTNAAKNTTATFHQAGTYTFTATILNPAVGTIATSSVTVTVNQVAAGFSIVPTSATVAAGSTVQFTAGTVDQFGNLIGAPPAVTWSVLSGAGSTSSSGVYTAPAAAGSATVRATASGGVFSDAAVTVVAPVAWYKANASSGTTLSDSSGNGKDGTLTGTTTFTAGVSGNALSLSGGNATLPAGIVSALTDFTISAWVRPSSLANWARIFDFGTGTTVNMFLTDDAGGTNALRFAITTGGGSVEQELNGPAIVANTWTHVAVTLAGTTATLYVNGVAVANNAAMTLHPSNLGSTTQNYLGKSQYNDPLLQGSIDDFRIYGTALSTQQIKQLADPAIVSAAAAATNPVTTTSTTLSVLGSDVTAGESALIYTWSTTGTPPAPVNFSVNGTNAAKSTIATFTQAGTYNFQVTVGNPALDPTFATTNMVTVTVNQTLTTIAVSPPSVNLTSGQSQLFTAVGLDQFGNPLLAQPSLNWSLTNGSVGVVDGSGLYTAPQSPVGLATIEATSGAVSSNATVNVTYLKGDINFDGHFDDADLLPFLQALSDLTVYENKYNLSPQDLPKVADFNGDGIVSNVDLQSLLDQLIIGMDSGTGSLSNESVNAAPATNDAIASVTGFAPSATEDTHSDATLLSTPEAPSTFAGLASAITSKSVPLLPTVDIPASSTAAFVATHVGIIAHSIELRPRRLIPEHVTVESDLPSRERGPEQNLRFLMDEDTSALWPSVKRYHIDKFGADDCALDELFAAWS